ncbi:hypothetical protein COCNU_scaffold001050G000020 [Cocos nucifera]|nr:hypothetical protein [Cocos nucifera]
MNSGGKRRERSSRNPSKQKLRLNAEEVLERKLGFDLFTEGEKRLGWLLTFAPDGSTFKVKYRFPPYFYAAAKEKMELEVEAYLRRRYEGEIADIEIVEKEDLDLKNHLSGLHKAYLKLSFDTVQQLMHVKNDLMHVVERNQAKSDAAEAFESIYNAKSKERPQIVWICSKNVYIDNIDFTFYVLASFGICSKERPQDYIDCITDLREYDVPYHVRFAIDNDVRCGQWYDVNVSSAGILLEKRADLLQRAEVHVCAFDIETTKLPLKFPDAEYDLIMMISYMIDGQGYLIINREAIIVNHVFTVKMTPVWQELLKVWFSHMEDVKPGIYVTYNGDFFDWPFIEKRAAHHGLKLSEAVTKAKLGYDPLEVNPEDMVRFAMEQPQMMASYSVSDAVATYYLYMTYIHPFIFSLATIIPMTPDEVLRKGSGTLCEMLLMVQAYKANIICPNKHQDDPEKFYNNRLLESETYIGGHVECLESGVFRSDLPTKFQLEPSAYEQLIRNLDRDLQYAITVEGKMDIDSILNYEDVKNAIVEKPPSIVSDVVCTACDFNRPGKNCLRKLEWIWRGEIYMGKISDYYHIKRQIESELVENGEGQAIKPFLDLPKSEQQLKLKERLRKYCQKAYKRVLDKPITELREAGICMRENPFYVDTVRSFRDRRYEYKGLNKVWKGKLAEAKSSGNSMKIQEAQDMVVLYDSLQLAHKCILNSFYGYVMRKDPNRKLTISYPCVMLNVDVARNNTNDQYQTLKDPITKTYTTHSECSIEFEVDGPYKAMILPASKAEGILIKKRYAVFNHDGTLAELKGFEIKRRGDAVSHSAMHEMYVGMRVSPGAIGKVIDGCSCAQVSHSHKLVMDKSFFHFSFCPPKNPRKPSNLTLFMSDLMGEVHLPVLPGTCWFVELALGIPWQWSLAKLPELLCSESIPDNMPASDQHGYLKCYGEGHFGSLVTGLLWWLVGTKDRFLDLIVIFSPPLTHSGKPKIAKFYLRKWCKISSDVGIRSIVDWSYYKQRLSSAIQKIITIPAAMQKVSNPVPRVVHPDWLHKKVREKEDRFRQRKLVDIFSAVNKDETIMHDETNVGDMEDFVTKKDVSKGPRPVVHCYEVNKENYSSKQSCPEAGLILSHKQQNATLCRPLMSSNQNGTCGESVDRNIDYQAWLEVKKRKWKDSREERKRRRLGIAKMSQRSAGAAKLPASMFNYRRGQDRNGVSSFFRRQELALVQSHWQIIQVVPSTQPGHFFAWVVADGIMQKVPIDVPRVFYLNTKAPVTEEFPGRRVRKILPHSRSSFNLIEVVINEDQFRAEKKKLAAHLADPEVEGIYETNVPLEFSAILQIGCVCKVDKAARLRNLQDGWNVSELHMKTTAECSYLEQTISFFYLYHSMSEGRAIYVIYFPVSSTIFAVVVNPFQNKELSSSLLEKLFREACQTLSIEPPTAGSATYKVDYVQSIEAGIVLRFYVWYPELNQLEYGPTFGIRSYAHKLLIKVWVIGPDLLGHRHPGPAIGVIECPNIQVIRSGMRILDDFPCISIPCNARDSNYQILWISDDGIPDLGGTYEGDTCFADEVIQPALTYPGAYRRVTVELKIHHLAVNALLKSNQVDEIEGGSIFGFDHEMHHGPVVNETDFDEASACAPAFQVLKQLIQRCISDAVASGNVFADAILQHLYRWLCSPLSKLHDPALHRVLHKVMKKLFALLLAEFRKLGATIIFANFSKIVIDTGKIDLSAAHAYCDCLLKTLQTRDLFEWIELEPLHFWHSLLFMDQYNYGGILAKSTTLSHTDNLEDEAEVDIVSSWNIAEYLPKITQDHFVLIVSEFLYIPWKHLKEQVATRATMRDDNSCTQSITITAAEALEVCVTEYLKDQISNYFTEKLLRIVRDTLHHFKGRNKIDKNEPAYHGLSQSTDSQVHKGDAALEFIKHVCAVLALDQNVQHDILRMRKNLLKLVHVKEFAPEAQFHDPSPSFILPNVICSYCNDCRDLDLCRDSALSDTEWRCSVPQCGQSYNREQMENSLLQIVRQREKLYHLQDLVCLRCRQVKAAHLAEQCVCGGSFRCKEDSFEFLRKMQVFLNIAANQKFQLLDDCTSWIIESPLQIRKIIQPYCKLPLASL